MNADCEDARALLGDLEQSYSAFQKVAFPYVLPLRGVTRVIALENLDDLSDFGRTTAAGRYATRITPFESTAFLVLTKPRAGRAFKRSLYQHEIAHRFIGYYHPGIPIWLNEGLAEYYSTLRFDGDLVVIGEYLDNTTFSEVIYNPAYRNGVWSLVHTLTTLPRGLERLDSYLDTLHAGQLSEEQAWLRAFGEVSESELEARFRSFLSAHETITWRANLRYEAVAPLTERALSASESHTLLAEIYASHEQGEAKARAELERAISADPREPEAYFLRAWLDFSLDAPERFDRISNEPANSPPSRGATRPRWPSSISTPLVGSAS